MKKGLLFYLMVAVTCIWSFSGNTQIFLSTQPATSTVNCNGFAEIDTNYFSSTNWYWTDSSGQVLQQGDYGLYNLCPGQYKLIHTGSNGGNITSLFTIYFNSGTNYDPCAHFTGLVNQVVPVTNTANCNGKIGIDLSGGQFPYTFTWQGIANNVNGPVLQNVCSGNYSVVVTDDNNCTLTLQGYVPVDTTTAGGNGGGTGTGPCANFSGTITSNATSSTNCTGNLNAMINGGTFPYTFQWNGPNVPSTANGPVLNNVCSGNYYVMVTDSNNCQITLQGFVPVDTTTSGGNGTGGTQFPCNDSLFNVQPTIVNCSSSTTQDGAIQIVINGSYGPYTAVWLPMGVTTYNVNGLLPGNYTLELTNSNGCTQTFTYYVGVNGTNNPCANFGSNFSFVPVTDSVNCNGSLTINVMGGTAPFTYVWNGNTTNSNNTLSGLCSGGQFATVTDSNGCTTSIQAFIPYGNSTGGNNGGGTAFPCNDSLYNVQVNVINSSTSASCNGGINLVVNGTFGPYTINWSNTSQVGFNINSLCSGTYMATISNGNGCVQTHTYFVGIDSTNNGGGTNGPCANFNGVLTSTPVSNTTNCNGSLYASISGGTAPYDFLWNGPNVPSNSNGPALINVCSGGYYVIVKDSNNCQITLQGYVPMDSTNSGGGNNFPCGDSLFNAQENIIPCSNPTACDGSISLTLTGAFAPFTCVWSNGQTTFNPIGLCAGDYTITVTNANGCTFDHTFNVGVDSSGNTNPCANSTLSATTSSVPSTSYPNCNGEIIVDIFGGTAPYTIYGNNNSMTVSTNHAVINNVCPSYYMMNIMDANGCSTQTSAIVYGDSTGAPNPCANSNISILLNPTFASSPTSCDGSIITNVTGGVAPYYYQWNNGTVNDDTLTNLCSGIYAVTVVDANGCAFTANSYVGFVPTTTNPPLNGYVIPTGVSQDGLCDGTASVIVYGGQAPYTFNYANGTSGSSAINLCQGLQNVVVYDAAGDSLVLDFLVASPANVTTTTNYQDSTVVDSVYTTATTDCTILFSSIDSAYITSVYLDPSSVATVTWNVVYSGGTTATITQAYVLLNTANGVYTFVLQVYCPNKSIGNYLTASDQYYVDFSEAGIKDLSSDEQTSVYPNPFRDNIVVKMNDNQNSEITITDITGKVIKQVSSSNEVENINTTSFPAGTYIVNVKNNKGNSTYKIVK